MAEAETVSSTRRQYHLRAQGARVYRRNMAGAPGVLVAVDYRGLAVVTVRLRLLPLRPLETLVVADRWGRGVGARSWAA